MELVEVTLDFFQIYTTLLSLPREDAPHLPCQLEMRTVCPEVVTSVTWIFLDKANSVPTCLSTHGNPTGMGTPIADHRNWETQV